MAPAVWVVLLVTSMTTATAGAPTAARLQVVAGSNASCPWKVALLDGDGDDGGRQICTEELGISFGGSRNIANVPTLNRDYNSKTVQSTVPPPWIRNWPALPDDIDIEGTQEPELSAFPTTAPAGQIDSGASKVVSLSSPPEGYELLPTGGFYKLHLQKKRWYDARRICEMEGAHLVILDSKEEAVAVRDFLESKNIATEEAPSFTIHAGFSLDIIPTHGKSLWPIRWDIDQPSIDFCGQLNFNAWLLYGTCSRWLSFLCEYGTTERMNGEPNNGVINASTVDIHRSNEDCSLGIVPRMLTAKGYTPFPGWKNTYVKNLNLYDSNWKMSNDDCEADGANLPVIDSEKTAEALLDYMEINKITHMYVGLKTGPPVTVLGTPLSEIDYQRWTTAEPQRSCFYVNKELLHYAVYCDSDDEISSICMVNISNR